MISTALLSISLRVSDSSWKEASSSLAGSREDETMSAKVGRER